MGKNQLFGIKKMVYDIIVDTYSTGEKEKYPIQSAISNKVLEIRNKEIDPNWENTEEFKKTDKGFYESCQSSVSKHLKSLCNEKRILKLENRTYIPYNTEVARQELMSIIIKTIPFNRSSAYILASHDLKFVKKKKDDVHVNSTSDTNVNAEIRYSTCSLLVDVKYDYMEKAKDLFRQYIGVENCYEIAEFQGKILIMLEGDIEIVKTLRNDIRKMVRLGYDRENASSTSSSAN